MQNDLVNQYFKGTAGNRSIKPAVLYFFPFRIYLITLIASYQICECLNFM